jgi:hypothetical protein
MNYEEITKPHLIEPGVRYFLRETLKQTHEFKLKYQNTLFNIGLLVFFLLILGIILVVKYKGRLTEDEKRKKEREKQQYILTKIKQLQESKRIAHQELITGLPNWENEYENIHGKRY